MAANLNRGLARAFVAAAVLLASASLAGAAPRTAASVSVHYFYADLEPYGRWVDHRIYGVVWVPYSGEPDWHPYAYGRWVWTADYGWYWDSDEDFGWATYHYGRWALTAEYGWVWVPDDVWGPAWVEWRYGDGHVGWAPMPPESEWRGDTVVKVQARGGTSSHEASWVFVAESDFVRGRVRAHRVPSARNRVMLRASANAGGYTAVKGRIVNRGVDVARLSTATGVQIQPVRATLSSSLDGYAKARAAGAVSIYRPRIVARTNLDLDIPVDAHARTHERIDVRLERAWTSPATRRLRDRPRSIRPISYLGVSPRLVSAAGQASGWEVAWAPELAAGAACASAANAAHDRLSAVAATMFGPRERCHSGLNQV